MKPDIHPAYNTIQVTCACGNSFETRSTLGENLHVEICSACHPFYTGKQKIVDTAGRVGRLKPRTVGRARDRSREIQTEIRPHVLNTELLLTLSQRRPFH